MCKKLVCLTCFVVVLTLTGQVCATDYYVDSSGGNDNNSGTSPGEAWQSLDKVNGTVLGPGDNVYLKYDSQWNGRLEPQGSGAEGNPIIIDRYGGTSSKPRIDGGGCDEGTVCLWNNEYIELYNLEVTNEGGSRGAKRYGVLAYAKDTGGPIHHVVMKDLFIHNVNGTLKKDTTRAGSGIQIKCNGGSYFDGLVIEDCHLLTTDRDGIATHNPYCTRPQGGGLMQDVSINCVFRGNLIEDCGGDAIKIWGFRGALVEYNVVNGHHVRATDAAAGIWPFESDLTVIQFNEVYNGAHTKDGQAFDADDDCWYTTIQYNYSHDNIGGFLLVCGLPSNKGNEVTGTVVRYNISQNDGSPAARVFHLSGGGVQDTYIYNNTIYVGEGLSTPMILMQDWRGAPDNTQFYNNIFTVYGDVSYEWNDSTNNILNNNVFYGNHTNPPTDPGQTPYDPNAITSDPMLVNPGSGGIGLDSVDGYQLQTGSPCIDAGADPGIAQDDPNYPNGGRDYWNNTLPANGPELDVGAHEKGGGGPPDTTPPEPDPMTWDTVPYSTGDSSIAMVATTATDDRYNVKYYFSCISGGGHDSGWQDDTFYEDTGLQPDTTYTYTVKARDTSPNQNQTAESTAESATTDPADTTPPSPDPMTWATLPYALNCTSISMTATTATDDSGVEYYFDETTGNAGGDDSGWQDDPTYVDAGLSAETTYTYTVTARDKSVNQNTTAASTAESATTPACGGGLPWADDFQDGDISDWTVTAYEPGEPGYVNVANKGNPGPSAELRGYVWFEHAVDTSGFTDIHVYFDAIQKGLDVTKGEAMTLEYYDGVDWILIGSVTETSWTSFDKSCGSGADNNPSFRIRFSLNSNHTAEWARVDNVIVDGTAQ
jgi:hypothetical protein